MQEKSDKWNWMDFVSVMSTSWMTLIIFSVVAATMAVAFSLPISPAIVFFGSVATGAVFGVCNVLGEKEELKKQEQKEKRVAEAQRAQEKSPEIKPDIENNLYKENLGKEIIAKQPQNAENKNLGR